MLKVMVMTVIVIGETTTIMIITMITRMKEIAMTKQTRVTNSCILLGQNGSQNKSTELFN